jgi:hypothetical protein
MGTDVDSMIWLALAGSVVFAIIGALFWLGVARAVGRLFGASRKRRQ